MNSPEKYTQQANLEMQDTDRATAASHALPTHVGQHVPLAPECWFSTGGPARFFAEPTTQDEFADTLTWAQRYNLDLFVMGKGANILVSDEGFDGVMIRPNLKTISYQDQGEQALITAGAGVELPDLISWCLENGFGGLEEFSGIPGTVGGAVYINLHYFEFLIEQFLESVTVIQRSSGNCINVTPEWLAFGYNQSRLHEKEFYVTAATFKLKKLTPLEAAYAQGRSKEITRHRVQRYPYRNTCGSFFRNFHPHEVTLESAGKKAIWVAYYLDKLGLKGSLSVGGAVVSYQHANMIVNTGTATSHDIIDLAYAMQQAVHKSFGLIPQPECQFVGFKDYPLMKY